MQRSTRYGLLVIILCILAALVYSHFNKPSLTDSQQISNQLAKAVQGANSGSAQDVASVISGNFKDPAGENKDTIRALLVRIFSSQQNMHYAITAPLISVNGDGATADFSLVVTDRRADYELGNRQMHVQFAREHGRVWLIFPTSQWMVTSTDLTAASVGAD